MQLSSSRDFGEVPADSGLAFRKAPLDSSRKLDLDSADATLLPRTPRYYSQRTLTKVYATRLGQPGHIELVQLGFPKSARLMDISFNKAHSDKPTFFMSIQENAPFVKNRRTVYSSVWAFASLNYLYADLVGLMDKNKLAQYQTGVVDGLGITPEFLTVAAGFMQIPMVNVFLPQVIKNEKALRWVQIASGAVMTLVQSGTLLVGRPTPYYVLFSAVEIAATSYITINAIRWKPTSGKQGIPAAGK